MRVLPLDFTALVVVYLRAVGQLDLIEEDPTDESVRRRLIRPGKVWAIAFARGDDDYLILWDLDGDVPVIRYLGPDVLF